MSARSLDDRSGLGSRRWGKLAALLLALLVVSGCVRVRRGWLINLNLSLEWNRIPWRAGPDGHYEIDPPDCVACGHHVPGHHCPRCATQPRPGGGVAGAQEKLPVLQPPGKLQAVPTQPAWPQGGAAVEEVPGTASGPNEQHPPSSSSPAEKPGTSSPSSGEAAPQAASWYGRSLGRPWVFRTAQAEHSLSHRSVRLQHGQRQVR